MDSLVVVVAAVLVLLSLDQLKRHQTQANHSTPSQPPTITLQQSGTSHRPMALPCD